MKATKQAMLKKIENMLYARRNNNVALEQKIYEDIMSICESMNVDFVKTIEQGTNMLKSRIAPSMNGIV